MVAENVYFQAQIGECAEFTNADTRKQRITVVISPLKIYTEESTVKVNSGCNMWKACHNIGCQFSLSSHPEIKSSPLQPVS